MEKPSKQEKELEDLFRYSKYYLNFFWLGKIASYLFPVLISLFVLYLSYLLNYYSDKVPRYWGYVILASLVLIVYIFDYVIRTKETRGLKEQKKAYAKSLTRLHYAYNKALEEIKARDEFLSIASHELKTPLTSMLLKLNAMLNSIRNVSLSRFSVQELMAVLENAQAQIKWLTAMINDFLNVSLMTTGKLNLEKERVDLVKITNSVKENFSESLKHSNYIVKIYASKPVIGYWDKTRLEQAVTNLFSNAIKYGLNKPIEIKIGRDNAKAKFIIKDQGIGISSIDKKIIFKPFERPKSVDGFKKGLGVGLYLTNQIVKAHGGKIKVFSTPRRGSTFALELPIPQKLE